MAIIDAQVHTWDRESAQYPWAGDLGTPQRTVMVRAHFSEHLFPMDALIAAMDDAGVDAGIATVPSIFGFDNSYALDAMKAHPDRLAVVALVDPNAPDMEERVRALGATPGVLGIRIMIFTDPLLASVQGGPHRRLIAALQRHGVPLFLYPPRYLGHVAALARDFPDLRIVLDHLGFPQPPVNVSGADKDRPMFEGWEHLIGLARHANVAIKVSAFPSMSGEKFPYRDLWPRLHQLIGVFGVERLFWGTDFTRVASLLSYAEGVNWIPACEGLSPADKASLMGGAVRRYFGWPPAGWVPRSAAPR
jgi:predicted TIM-barrel fold metal-dependent hydrolase